MVLFVKNVPRETVAWLLDCSVTVISADIPHEGDGIGWRKAAVHFWLVAATVAFCGALRLAGAYGRERVPRVLRAMHRLYGFRHTLFMDYLTIHGWRYQCVLLADSRDVVFQASPFPSDGLHAFGEIERIGESHFAKRWFQLSYGIQAWKKLADLPFLCAGVTLGDSGSMLRYLQTMDEECRNVMAFSEDQAVHNYVIHTGLVPSTVHDIGEGAAINLNAVKLETLNVSADKLVDSSGKPYAVVHQYDRVKNLAEKLADCHLRTP